MLISGETVLCCLVLFVSNPHEITIIHVVAGCHSLHDMSRLKTDMHCSCVHQVLRSVTCIAMYSEYRSIKREVGVDDVELLIGCI